MQPTSHRLPLEDAARRVGVEDSRVLAAFRTVDRKLFVPLVSVHLANSDQPIPIPHRQVTTQPSLIAVMVAALHLSGSERVLEVGTGLGYETAILAQLCTHVYSIERFADLTESARESLQRAGIRNATLFVGDGSKGIAAHAPYDAIIVAAAAPTVSPALVEQLREGGSLVQPIGLGGDEMVTAFRKREGQFTKEGDVIAAYFVPLVRDVAAG